MAEILVQNFDNWLEKLDQSGIDAYKDRAVSAYIAWRDAKVALTAAEITKILQPMDQENRDKWTARHNIILNMSQKDIDGRCDVSRDMFQAKYDARSKKGDIVEIQEDGFWTVVGRGWDKAHFDLLVVPGLPKEEALQKYGGCLKDGEILKAKFRANITMTPDVNKKQELTKAAFETAVAGKV